MILLIGSEAKNNCKVRGWLGIQKFEKDKIKEATLKMDKSEPNGSQGFVLILKCIYRTILQQIHQKFSV